MSDLDLDLASLRRTAEAALPKDGHYRLLNGVMVSTMELADEFHAAASPPTVIALLDALAAEQEDFAAMKVEAQSWKEQAEEWAVRSAAQQKVVEVVKVGHHRNSLLRPPGSCFCRTANCPILAALDESDTP